MKLMLLMSEFIEILHIIIDSRSVHSKNVDYRIRKYYRHIGISEKATHKIRKTYISTLIDSGLNINEIRKLARYEDEHTTYNNYCFNHMTNQQTKIFWNWHSTKNA